MDLARFKKLHKRFTSKRMHVSEMEGEYLDYVYAINKGGVCTDWYLLQKIKAARIQPEKYCCLKMAYHLIEDKKEKQQLKNDPEYINYDSVITYCKSQQAFGIPIHDGGSSFIVISYCPWCGKKLKKIPGTDSR